MGTPLPGSHKKPNGDSCVSGTEWEYEDAQQAGKRILLYRRTEKPRLDVDDPDFEEKRRRYRLLDEFFKRFEAPDGSLTGGYTGYATTEEFEKRFRQDIEGLLRQWDDEPSETKNLGPQGPGRAAPERLKREALDERREKSRVVRGGGFHDNPRGVRCADRYRGHPDAHHRDLGFRVVVRPLL